MRRQLGRGSTFALGLFATLMTAVLGTALLPAPAARADQAWPTRPVKFILTLGPGSGTDIGARLLADRLAQRWGQPVVVENRPGGDGIVAINAFVSAHDDYQLLFSPTSSFTAHPCLHDHLPYRPSDLDADRANLQHHHRHFGAVESERQFVGSVGGDGARRTGQA